MDVQKYYSLWYIGGRKQYFEHQIGS
jgi:hypothetical protein